MKLSRIADKTILPSTGAKVTFHQEADVQKIIAVIMMADQLSQPFTAQFAARLKRYNDTATLKAVWQFVKDHIEYVRDNPGHEIVKSPGATWEDRFGDCKSFSVFIGSLLRNMGYKYKYRVAFYDPKEPEQGHIYPVAVLPGGREIVVDAVHTRFDSEVPYWKAHDFVPGKYAQIGGAPNIGSKPQWVEFVKLGAIAAAIYAGMAYSTKCSNDKS